MAGAQQGTGTLTGYPMQQFPWGQPWGGGGVGSFPGQQLFTPQLGQGGGSYVPQQLHLLQTSVQQLLQLGYVQQQYIQQLLQTIPLQLHQIQHLIQFALQQTHQSPWQGQQSFLPGGFPSLGPSQGLQPQMFGGQGGFGPQGFGGQGGYVM